MKKSHNRNKTPLRTAFGKIVRHKREALELTQEEAAEKASMHPTYWGSVERGERNIALDNIVSMGKALECSPKNLMPDC